MKVVILAGGRGTRISEESLLKPKPMIEIGEAPIIWHIMKSYSHYGFNEFVICIGYKGYIIKEYFANYYRHMSDAVTYDYTSGNALEIHHNTAEPWRVTLVDTGPNTMTGGRVKRIRPYTNGPFMLTYGDGVSDIDIGALAAFHKASGKYATMTAIQPDSRFGRLELSGSNVTGFAEKIKESDSWINGGFMVLEPEVFDYIPDGDDAIFERAPLENLAKDGQLCAYKHTGFWQPMDTLREKIMLDTLWASGEAPWKVWK